MIDIEAVRALIQEAEDRGITLWIQDNNLRCKALPGAMSGELRSDLQSRKQEIVAVLCKPEFKRESAKQELLRLPDYHVHWWRELEINQTLANMHIVARLTARLTLTHLKTSLSSVFARHDILRARASIREDIPFLAFDEETATVIDVTDCTSIDMGERERLIETIIERAVWTPFQDGRLFRAFLIKADEENYVIGFVLHHCVADFNSCRILAREILAELFDPTNPTASRAPALQYSDYLRGTNEWLAGPGPLYKLAYWKAHLAGAPNLCLPHPDLPEKALVAPVSHVSFQIDQDRRARCAEVARRSATTLHEVMLAAHSAALWSMLQVQDIVVTTLVSGRDRPDLLNLVGNTADSVPLRMFLRPEMAFTDLLAAVHREYADALRYQVPWGLLLQGLERDNGPRVYPMFNYIPAENPRLNQDDSPAATPGFKLKKVTIKKPQETGRVSWFGSHEMHMYDTGRSIDAFVKYSSSRYPARMMQDFAQRFCRCLEDLTANPGRALGALQTL